MVGVKSRLIVHFRQRPEREWQSLAQHPDHWSGLCSSQGFGVSEITQSDLRCTGELNRYSHPDVAFLRFGLTSRTDQATTIDLKDSQNWSTESQPRPLDQWRTPPSFTRPAHEQSKDDFLLRPDVLIDAGFNPAILPSIQPLAAAPPPRPPAPATVGPLPESLNSPLELDAALVP